MSTNLGTAYVSVMPSMKGFGASVQSGLSGIDTTGAGSIMGARAASGFAGGMAKSGIVIGAASALAGKAFDAVASSADRAISRVDTMQNFPKVMKNLGYSADDAAKSIQVMSDNLDGLPTSLDSMVSMTQQLAPLTGDLSKATEVGLAFNNMMLAGGASTMEQASAMTQFSQALAKGKPDMQDWRALQQVMPGQLDQVAKAMLGAEANSTALYQSLKNGDVTMNDFMDTVVRLNTEGANGFASFEQQARDSTTGIQTAIDNLHTRIAKGVATLIDAVGQENISGAINTLSEGIGDIANDLAQDLKAATGFVKEHEGEIKTLVSTLSEIAPMAIRAWGALKLFKGGKALFSGLTSGAQLFMGKLLGMSGAAAAAGTATQTAATGGAAALGGLSQGAGVASGAIAGVSAGAAGLVAGLAVGIVVLDAYNKALWGSYASAWALNDQQRMTVETAKALSDSFAEVTTKRDEDVAAIDKQFSSMDSLVNEYNSLIDANGQVIEGNEARASEIIGTLADALGVERGAVESLIDEYGHLGEAAESSLDRRRAEKLLEANEAAYEKAIADHEAVAQSYADSQKTMQDTAAASAAVQATYSQAIQDSNDMLAGTPEALMASAYQYGNLANATTEATKSADEAATAFDDVSKTYTDSMTTIKNQEGLAAALNSGDAAQIEEWSTRVQYSIVDAENGTRESLENQVATFQSSYDQMAAAVANGDTSLQGSLDSMGMALQIAQGELAAYNAVDLNEKFASISINDGQLRDVQGRLYTWNGTNLIDQDGNVVVDMVQLVDAQNQVHTWNGTNLVDHDARLGVDYSAIGNATSAWANASFPNKTTYIDVIRREQGATNAAGGFFSLHAAGGFITNGPTALGYDESGTLHIAGEAGREWIKKHADGTTSILPIQNRKYLEPYASEIAQIIGARGGTGPAVVINLSYSDGGGAAEVAKIIGDQLIMQGIARGLEYSYV